MDDIFDFSSLQLSTTTISQFIIGFIVTIVLSLIVKIIYEKFSNYEGQIKHQQKKSLTIHLREKTSIKNTTKYKLFVDTEKWRITKIHISQNQEPRNIEGKFFYTRRGGQWVVAEATSEYMVNSQTYTEKTEYSYKRANTFWLVHKIKQTVRQDDHLIRSYRIQLNDYKVNLEN